eukprot:CAMPEP_0117667084 /NCGR_PEP_ID=MMETSP0804-20121206/10756_1 /TAXON_ID=1074897 /ORGANISM="Tetraselmis astigmatica, Strain CCMP880" /LENGTH=183 /DNA_ID=CAMNT_0005474743 /DNA_START=151 /DNA_END=703 /DNA_ORIENTATION=-
MSGRSDTAQQQQQSHACLGVPQLRHPTRPRRMPTELLLKPTAQLQPRGSPEAAESALAAPGIFVRGPPVVILCQGVYEGLLELVQHQIHHSIPGPFQLTGGDESERPRRIHQNLDFRDAGDGRGGGVPRELRLHRELDGLCQAKVPDQLGAVQGATDCRDLHLISAAHHPGVHDGLHPKVEEL